MTKEEIKSWAVWAHEEEELLEKTEKVKIIEEHFNEKIYPTTHHQREVALDTFLQKIKEGKIGNWEGELYLVGSFLTESDDIYSDVDIAMTTYGIFTPTQAHDLFSIQKRIIRNRGLFIDVLHTSILEDPNRLLLIEEAVR